MKVINDLDKLSTEELKELLKAMVQQLSEEAAGEVLAELSGMKKSA